jgi:hybrid cluster-associated redox disulfide protein
LFLAAMEQSPLSPLRPVGELLAERPALANLFLELHLDCVGCSMTKFCTLEEVSRHYELELETLLQRIQERMERP